MKRLLFVAAVAVVLLAVTVTASHKEFHELGVSRAQQRTANNTHQPYRTGYHFQPRKNWMNDPNGPLYYKGWYHFFYQYNRDAAVWGNITWGHAVSKDMVHWRYLHTALKGDQWYDVKGIWSGSATFLPSGVPVLLYTGWSNESHQIQAMAVPEDPSDPLLREWDKPDHNPIAVAPPGFNTSQFRDPTTAWRGDDGLWKMVVGAVGGPDQLTGMAPLFTSKDFNHWTYTGKSIQEIHGTGMWECPDFFPVPLSGRHGLETSVMGAGVRHVLKVSLDLKKHDYYSTGFYNETTDQYTAEDKRLDTGLGLRYDYGKFYASKTFFDQNKNRRILWGWANESSSVQDDIDKGWSSVQCMPRHIWLDPQATTNLLQWPIDEVDNLRRMPYTKKDVVLEKGSMVELMGGSQSDIEVEFALPEKSKGLLQANELLAENGALDCSALVTGNGMGANSYGPFGVHVLASQDLQERTSIFYYVTHDGQHGNWKTLVCADHSHSSLQQDVDKTMYGSYVRVHKTDTSLTLRILVDHSIVETFAQSGRTVMTSRVYPELAVKDHAHTYVFNHGNPNVTVKSATSWDMANVMLKNY